MSESLLILLEEAQAEVKRLEAELEQAEERENAEHNEVISLTSQLLAAKKENLPLKNALASLGAEWLEGGGLHIKKNLYINFCNEQMRRALKVINEFSMHPWIKQIATEALADPGPSPYPVRRKNDT